MSYCVENAPAMVVCRVLCCERPMGVCRVLCCEIPLNSLVHQLVNKQNFDNMKTHGTNMENLHSNLSQIYVML